MAGIQYSVRAEVEDAKRYFRGLREQGVNRAASNSLNVVGRTVRRRSIDKIAERRHVRRSVIRQNVVIGNRARSSELRTVVEGRGGPISLKEYGAKQTSLGVIVNVTGTPKLIPGAFGPGFRRESSTGRAAKKRAISTRPGQSTRLGGHVLKRVGRARLPIRKLMGPSIRTGFAAEVVRREQERVLRREWPGVFQQKLQDQLRRLAARSRGR